MTDSLIDFVRKTLSDGGLRFVPGPHPDSLLLRFAEEQGQLDVIVCRLTSRRVLLMYTGSGLCVPVQYRRDAAEFVTRTNYGLPIGNLELDMSDGEVRFKTSADLHHCEPSHEAVLAMLILGLSTYSRYLPGLMLVATGALDAEDAIAHVERPSCPS